MVTGSSVDDSSNGGMESKLSSVDIDAESFVRKDSKSALCGGPTPRRRAGHTGCTDFYVPKSALKGSLQE